MDIKNRKYKEVAKKSESDVFLRKHVGLIHCENKLTLIQRKICNILLFNALDKIDDQDIYEIPIRQLSSLVGYNSNDSRQIKGAVKTLISTVMEWNLLEDSKFLNNEEYPEEEITWNASSLLAGASIKNGIIRYSYSPQLKSVLSSLDIYGRINLFVQSKFNSAYSLVLYENCVRFKNIGQTSWFPIELLRILLGVPESKYASFKEFNRKVINVAVKEINLRSDIHIEPQFKRAERKISSIQFLITENDNYKPTFKKLPAIGTGISPLEESAIFEILMTDFQLTQKQAKEVLAQYDHRYIQDKIKLVKSKKHVEHTGAYILCALKQDYKENKRKPLLANNQVIENSYLREAREATKIVSLKNKYTTYKLKKYADFVQQQGSVVQAVIEEKFEQTLKLNTEVFRFYKKSGYFSPFVMTEFVSFIDNNFPDIIGDYMCFDDYITSEEG